LEKFGKIGIAADLFRKVKNIYKRMITCIKTNKGWSAWFERRLGVRLGNVLSQIFNIIMMSNKMKD
jgi:hypothetical protein